MNLTRTLAMARKEFIHIRRDPRSLALAVAIPMLLLWLFACALTMDVDRVPVAVWDQNRTKDSRDFVSLLAGSRYFSLRAPVWSHREGERAIDRREVLLVLVIPVDFSSTLAAGRRARVQVLVDGSDANTATIAMGYVRAMTVSYNRAIAVEHVLRRGGAPPVPPIELRPRVWFNSDMESRNFVIPGLIAVIMMVIAGLLTSLTVAREWETGTMEQLISTPVRGPELVLGKLLPYFLIGMFDVLVAVLMGRFVFHVPLRGSVWLLFGTAAVFLAGALGQGMLISIATRHQLLASQIAVLTTFVPAFLLSGFMFAVKNMPVPIQIISLAVPARYFVALLRGIYLKGTGLDVMAGQAALLAAFAAVTLTASVRRFRKKVAA